MAINGSPAAASPDLLQRFGRHVSWCAARRIYGPTQTNQQLRVEVRLTDASDVRGIPLNKIGDKLWSHGCDPLRQQFGHLAAVDDTKLAKINEPWAACIKRWHEVRRNGMTLRRVLPDIVLGLLLDLTGTA